jgi:hypothetical protein
MPPSSLTSGSGMSQSRSRSRALAWLPGGLDAPGASRRDGARRRQRPRCRRRQPFAALLVVVAAQPGSCRLFPRVERQLSMADRLRADYVVGDKLPLQRRPPSLGVTAPPLAHAATRAVAVTASVPLQHHRRPRARPVAVLRPLRRTVGLTEVPWPSSSARSFFTPPREAPHDPGLQGVVLPSGVPFERGTRSRPALRA